MTIRRRTVAVMQLPEIRSAKRGRLFCGICSTVSMLSARTSCSIVPTWASWAGLEFTCCFAAWRKP